MTVYEIRSKTAIAAELAHRDIEIERLRAALAESCEDHRSNVYDTTTGGGCALLHSAEEEIERLRGIVPEVLEKLNDELCAENEELKARLAHSGVDLQRAVFAERERCAKLVDVPPEFQAWEIHGGQETVDVLRDAAISIRATLVNPEAVQRAVFAEPKRMNQHAIILTCTAEEVERNRWESVAALSLEWMESAWHKIDGEWGPSGKTLDQACADGDEPEIAALRVLLPHCMCAACKGGSIHQSDCSVHNMPSEPNGPYDCRLMAAPVAKLPEQLKPPTKSPEKIND